MRRALLAVIGLALGTSVSRASLETTGVWEAGVWDTTVWAAGVWREGEYVPPESNPGTLDPLGLGLGLE